MEIQVNISSSIEERDTISTETTDIVTHALRHHEHELTRVEVHIDDENGPKGGADDIRCMVEARPKGLQPVAVTNHAATPNAAVRGAAAKLVALLDSASGRAEARRQPRTEQ